MHQFAIGIDSIHVDTGNNLIKPKLPTGRSEFDEFQWWKPAELLHAWLSHKVKLPPPQVTLIRDIVELGFSELAKTLQAGIIESNMQMVWN